MKLRFLITGVVLCVLVFVGNQYLRLGRDLIFHSSDVSEFTLSNGKSVRANKWYYQTDLLLPGQEFYGAGSGLGIMGPWIEGVATALDYRGEVCPIVCNRSNRTIADAGLAATPVGQKTVRAGVYDEMWISLPAVGDAR